MRHGFTPVLCTHTPGGVHEDDYVQMLLDRGVAGIIYISGQHADTTTDPSRYVRLRDRGLPIVLVNGYMPGVDAPFVSTDEDAALELTLNHLIHLGHTKIGLAIGPRRYVPAQRKIAAYRRYMSELLNVPEVDELIETEMYSVEGGQAAAVAADRKGLHGARLRVRPHGPRRGSRGARRGDARSRRYLRHRLRRLDAHRLHGPAVDDGAAAGSRDG